MLAISWCYGNYRRGSGGRKAAGFMRKPFFINDLGFLDSIPLLSFDLRLIAAVFCQELPLPSVIIRLESQGFLEATAGLYCKCLSKKASACWHAFQAATLSKACPSSS